MKTIRIIGFSLILTLVVTSPLILWLVHPETNTRVLVIDKTVPHVDYREHASLFWVLNHSKIPSPTQYGPWEAGRDYVGWYPEPADGSRAYGAALQKENLDYVDTLYIADSYGVYVGDMLLPEEQRTHLDYSRKIFGGFDLDEAMEIERFAAKGGRVIAEFNTFASPTDGEARERLENLLGVNWTEWTGRYFKDLANEGDVPTWARRNYLAHYGKQWDFTGPGYLITHEDTRLFVLQSDTDVGKTGLRIVRADDGGEPLLQNTYGNVPFYFWFDVVTPQPGTEVLARYRFDLTESGREKMLRFNLPASFPAVLVASREPLRMYMAGDFSDNKVPRGPHYLAGWTTSMSLGRFVERYRDQRAFFWEFYVPLVSNAFRQGQ